MPTVITCHEVPASSTPPRPLRGHRLFRAVREESRFGYLGLAEFDDDTLAADAVHAATATAALAGSYEAFHVNERAAPPFSADGSTSPVMFINCLQCPPARQDAAFDVWQQVNAYMVTKPGYRWHRLHRRTNHEAPFAFVNVVEWESVAAWEAAHDEGFRALAGRPDLPFVAVPTLCTPVEIPSATPAAAR